MMKILISSHLCSLFKVILIKNKVGTKGARRKREKIIIVNKGNKNTVAPPKINKDKENSIKDAFLTFDHVTNKGEK